MATPSSNGALPDRSKLVNKHLTPVIREPAQELPAHSTHLTVQGGRSSADDHIVHETGSGYVAAKFEGREQQMHEVASLLEDAGFIPGDFVEQETEWFYNALGIDDMYFSTETAEAISSHIHSLWSAKVAAFARGTKEMIIRLDKEDTDHAVYIDTSTPGITVAGGPSYEARLESKYLDIGPDGPSYRVETFRSSSKAADNVQSIRCYFVYQAHFKNPTPAAGETDIEKLGDERFLQKTTKHTKRLYQEIMTKTISRTGPVIDIYDVEGVREKRLVIGFKQGSAHGLFTALSDLYHYYGLTSSRKYVEQFSNGTTIMSLYLRPAPNVMTKHPPIEASIHQIAKEVSLLYCIPHNKFMQQFSTGRLSLQESIYAHCVWIFVQHFLNRLGNEYKLLVSVLDKANTVHAELLSTLKKRLRAETFTPEYIHEIIDQYPDLIHPLYLSFANAHYVQTRGDQDDFLPTISYQRLQMDRVLSDDELKALISKTTINDHHNVVMTAFRVFNAAVLKSNFYTPTKVALSFRLKPSFLPEDEYPQPLYGMFLVIGSEFRGFHLRFRDIARGGIRIVKSRSAEAYAINARSIFDENYNLANTQQRKNKDIPEGGSKGVVLLNYEHQDKQRQAFEKYIDSIIDLLLPPASPGIKDPIVDLHGKEEILFMGPDENTADLVDWATFHAKERGAPWWKSFFTGKSPKLGGIPHDTYGMTTLSVREYVKGIYRKLDLDESKVRKLQTGGPDGDLGSNEILLGKEKYCAVVDGSGVLYDPNGIDQAELLRLAKERKMIGNFSTSKLSKEGYRVLVEENNITLPSGEVVNNGTSFRNTYHLRQAEKYDMFVPCGGRPESIDFSTANRLIVDGKPTIPYIVEGANLFITQEAKLRLEKAGTIIFKDASANKGGVTSSSLEVLCSLSFNDAEFIEHMCVRPDGTVPAFYAAYVKDVQRKIQENARLEFEVIWREHAATKVAMSLLSDQLSLAITKMDEELQATELWDNIALRRSVLNDALPSKLLQQIGLEKILERVPDSYLRAIFGSYLASRFIYSMGINASPVSFFAFMSQRMNVSA
ncbi:hypothetical protein AMS68_000531 [Peltaster fructicola]|uniref:NAD-specific glutamate dehydrogenase n=1 Tax=Peltaster fructicola TaxID=286661 RepID=A0A6H0XJW6_9PEZI|nr:hypothetical protein AMS68_000531 [Peltaster fructicola]